MKRDLSKTIQTRYKRYLHAAIAGCALLLVSLGSTVAHAHSSNYDHREKSGRVMLNARGGLAVGIANAGGDLSLLGMVGLDLGVAVSAHYNAYLILTPQVDLRPGLFNVMVPLGFQYDIRLARGLYLYPRASIGYSALISNVSTDFGMFRFSANQVIHGGVAIPELGLKYVVNGRFNIGFEPLSFPVFFTDKDFAVWYRATVFLGFNF
jgi:hypothetical protein